MIYRRVTVRTLWLAPHDERNQTEALIIVITIFLILILTMT